jgi:hypothetical protein
MEIRDHDIRQKVLSIRQHRCHSMFKAGCAKFGGGLLLLGVWRRSTGAAFLAQS